MHDSVIFLIEMPASAESVSTLDIALLSQWTLTTEPPTTATTTSFIHLLEMPAMRCHRGLQQCMSHMHQCGFCVHVVKVPMVANCPYGYDAYGAYQVYAHMLPMRLCTHVVYVHMLPICQCPQVAYLPMDMWMPTCLWCLWVCIAHFCTAALFVIYAIIKREARVIREMAETFSEHGLYPHTDPLTHAKRS